MQEELQSETSSTIYPLEPERIDKDIALKIHAAIHDPTLTSVHLPSENGIPRPYIVSRAPNGCRQLIYNKIRFIEQNKSKGGPHAVLAKEGHQITWGIRLEHKWIYILDNEIM